MENIINSKCRNICGNTYKKGNLLFEKSEDRQILYAIVGNRVIKYDLNNNKQELLEGECSQDIKMMEINKDGKILVLVCENNEIVTLNTLNSNIINKFKMQTDVKCLKYSHDDCYLAIGSQNIVRIFYSPTQFKSIEPFKLYRKFKVDALITNISWSPDNRFLLTSLNNFSVSLNSLHYIPNYLPVNFTGHKSKIIFAHFNNDMQYVYTLSQDGFFHVFEYKNDFISQQYTQLKTFQHDQKIKRIKIDQQQENQITSENEKYYSSLELDMIQNKCRFIMKEKHILKVKDKFIKVKSGQMNILKELLIVGFKEGSFKLLKVSESSVTLIQELQISNEQMSMDSVSLNMSGNWIAMGMKGTGQLVVWEWRRRGYDITALAISPNGLIIATATIDGQVNLWDTTSWFSYFTFHAHQSKVTALQFLPKDSRTLFSASLDGTLKGYDIQKQKVFRNMSSNDSNQYISMAVESQGDVVCVGGQDPYNIYCFQIRTGSLMEVISGHEGPINCLTFSKIDNTLASGSWDKTVRIHDLFSRHRNSDILNHNSIITSVEFRPDGKQLAVTTLKADIYLWDVKQAQVVGIIESTSDIKLGRKLNQTVKADTLTNKHFSTLVYSPDGLYLICSGQFNYVCIYDINTRILLDKVQFTNNQSLDGMNQLLNSKNVKDGINVDLLQNYSDSDDNDDGLDIQMQLPGAKSIINKKHKLQLAVGCIAISYNMSNNYYALATTEGVLIMQVNNKHFTPYQLNHNLTLEHLQTTLQTQQYSKALLIALQLNHQQILHQIYLHMPADQIDIIVSGIPEEFIERMLELIGEMINISPDIHYHLLWLQSIFQNFSQKFTINPDQKLGRINHLKNILSTLIIKQRVINKSANQNGSLMDFILNAKNDEETTTMEGI